MSVKKPPQKKLPTRQGPTTSSTKSTEPVTPSKGKDGRGEKHSKGEKTLTYGVGIKSNSYDLTPHWDTHQIVEILWIDAIANAITEWMDLEDLENSQPCETLTVGYLLTDHPEWITIVSLLNDGAAGHAITIPRGMILTIRTLHR